ncbi:MAG: GNAT family N-acetyltransferase [Vibrio sp.]
MEFGVDYIIRPISPSDKVNTFKTGREELQPLKTFLRNQACEFQQGMIAQTYVCVALDKQEPKDKGMIIAYITLTCSELDVTTGYVVEDCPYANRYDYLPAVKIARLAVDSRYQYKGLGKTLIQLALDIAINDIYPTVGCRFVTTDAKPTAVDFYEKEGFTFLDSDENRERENPIMFIDLFKQRISQ